jgi:hypothetical protein
MPLLLDLCLMLTTFLWLLYVRTTHVVGTERAKAL